MPDQPKRTLSSAERTIAGELARAAALTVYQRPPKAKVERFRQAILETMSTSASPADTSNLERLKRDASAAGRKSQDKIDRLEAAVAAHGEALRHERELAVSESNINIEDARRVARALWAVLPAESKVELFEADAPWLPEWLRPASHAADQP